MRQALCLAPAKINLALHVTGRRPDGYHELDTLVAFAGIGDRLTARPGAEDRFLLSGPFGRHLDAGPGNLVLRARDALARQVPGRPAVEIGLEKNLPVASGIGGGSADAAATLLALDALWDVRLPMADLEAMAAQIGSDVPMCLHSRPLRARGRGERIELLPAGPALHAVLVNPGVEASTPAIFAGLEKRDNPPLDFSGNGLPAVVELAAMRNDLQAPAVRAFPVIGETLGLLAAQPDCLLARMSGSGATCFGLFPGADEAQAAAAAIARLRPDWWSVATVLHGGEMPSRRAVSAAAGV